MTTTIRGTIKVIKHDQGFGFITHEATGEDYFFHRSTVDRSAGLGFEDLFQDQLVAFVPADGPKGPRAMQVRPL